METPVRLENTEISMGGPTRWGNQLNGNVGLLKLKLRGLFLAPLAGAIS